MNYLRVGGKFKLSKKLGEGTFGTLYSGFNMQTKEEVASSTQQANQSVDGQSPMDVPRWEARYQQKTGQLTF